MFNRNIEKSLAVNVVKRGTGSKLYSKDFSMVKQGQHKLIMAKMVGQANASSVGYFPADNLSFLV
jgi:cell division protein FtsI (penicillin-binding protein 3)